MRQRCMKYLFRVVTLLLLLTGGVACMRELFPEIPGEFVPGLSVMPSIFRGDTGNLRGRIVETKGKIDEDPTIIGGDEVNGRDELRENFFGTLDVFVKKSSDSESTDWYDEYHLVAGQTGVITDPNRYIDANTGAETSLLDQAKQLLTRSWTDKYEQGVRYDIYVTANNPHTVATSADKPDNLAALKALNTHTGNIFQYYLPEEPDPLDFLFNTNYTTDTRNFLMDGRLLNWTPAYSGGNPEPEQVFDVDLKRAAAKIILNVKFSTAKTFPKAPLPTDQNPNPTPETDEHGIVYLDIKDYLAYIEHTAGQPRWKFVHFNYDVSDIDGGTPPSPEVLETLDWNYPMAQHGTSVNNCDNTFSLVTYTYPIDWTGDTDANRIPFILLSVFYTPQNGGDPLRCYYRIPVCDERTVTKLERNNIYIVDAEIASLGSFNENLETQDEQLRLEYHVIPWTTTDISQEATSVRLSDTKYLTVTPTSYTLKGDDTQSVDLQWYASVSNDDKRFVDIDVSDLTVKYVDATGTTRELTYTTSKQVRNADNTLSNYDNNADGTKDIIITATARAYSTNWHYSNSEKVVITITPSGIIEVQSDALESRAVKDISFKVKLKNASDIDPVTVTIRHYPLDNIQSFTGSWSSRWDGVATNYTLYTYNETKYYRKKFTRTVEGWETTNQATWAAGIGNDNNNRMNAQSPQTAVNGYYATGGSAVQRSYTYSYNRRIVSIDSYTWNGTTVTFNGTRTRSTGTTTWSESYTGDGDYVVSTSISGTGNGNSAIFNLWKYQYYYKLGTTVEETYDPVAAGWVAPYNEEWEECLQSVYEATPAANRKTEVVQTTTDYLPDGITEYTAQTVTGTPSTGSWVAWGEKNGTTSEGIFTAKVFYNGQCYPIYNYNTRGNGNNYTNLTNNHMYVVQITSTSDKYALGKPVLDANYQSQDKVASPAFMIASQLGAVSTTNSSTTAATHCGTYMEVGTDGTRYVGWRLPTKQEIEVIIDYQNGRYTGGVTMTTVLGGAYYWALDGTTANVPSGSGGSTTTGYVRCVRDLTMDDINRLNGTN